MEFEKKYQKYSRHLFEKIKDDFTKIDSSHKTLTLPINKIYFLADGAALIKSDENILSVVNGCGFIGLSGYGDDLLDANNSIMLDIMPGSCIFEVDYKVFFKKIEQQNAFSIFTKLLSANLSLLAESVFFLKKANAYQRVRLSVIKYNRNKSKIGTHIKLSSFVTDFSGVSRSRCMYILSELKKGKYIEVEKGMLVSISKLPENF